MNIRFILPIFFLNVFSFLFRSQTSISTKPSSLSVQQWSLSVEQWSLSVQQWSLSLQLSSQLTSSDLSSSSQPSSPDVSSHPDSHVRYLQCFCNLRKSSPVCSAIATAWSELDFKQGSCCSKSLNVIILTKLIRIMLIIQLQLLLVNYAVWQLTLSHP